MPRGLTPRRFTAGNGDVPRSVAVARSVVDPQNVEACRGPKPDREPVALDRSTRRRLLKTGGGVAVAAAVAGCFGSGQVDTPEEGEEDEPDPALRIDDDAFLSSAFPIELVDPSFEEATGFAGDARIAYVHWHGVDSSHWHQSPLEMDADGTRSGRTRFLLEGADAVALGPDETFTQRVSPTEATPAELLETAVDGDRVDIEAGAAGDGGLVFELWAGSERRWQSPPLPVEVR